MRRVLRSSLVLRAPWSAVLVEGWATSSALASELNVFGGRACCEQPRLSLLFAPPKPLCSLILAACGRGWDSRSGLKSWWCLGIKDYAFRFQVSAFRFSGWDAGFRVQGLGLVIGT